MLFRWGRLSVGSKQGDVTRYSVDLLVQDGPYADAWAGIAASELRSQLTTLCKAGTIVRQERT